MCSLEHSPYKNRMTGQASLEKAGPFSYHRNRQQTGTCVLKTKENYSDENDCLSQLEKGRTRGQ